MVVKNEQVVDSRINTNFFAVAPTLRVPKTQVRPMPFLADISNIGNGDDSGIKLEVAIYNGGTAEIGRLRKCIWKCSCMFRSENKVFTDQFTPPADVDCL